MSAWGRVMAFIAFAAVIGVAVGLLLDRVVVGMLVGGGILIAGVFLLISLISRANPPDTEA